MRRVDAVLVGIAVVLAGVWYVLRVAAPPDPAAAAPGAAVAALRPLPSPSPSPPESAVAAGSVASASPAAEAGPVLPAVEAVHKHKLGSCHGRLSATPAGLRYDPTRPGDGFDLSRAAIERFEMDARRRALIVKVRGGRTYTFTEPQGSGDRLAAFQKAAGLKPRARADR